MDYNFIKRMEISAKKEKALLGLLPDFDVLLGLQVVSQILELALDRENVLLVHLASFLYAFHVVIRAEISAKKKSP